jgi:RsiW-degrading membrane proteinase PrsW (M82 family)
MSLEMGIIIVVLAAIAPCAFWLWMIYRWDKYKPEPRWLLIRVFFYGMVIAVPVAFIESALYPGDIQNIPSVATAAYLSFGVVGVVEESAKFLVVRFGVYSSPHFEEPADGLVYSAAAALGFASLENIIYVLTFGWEVLLVRGLVSNIVHFLFSAAWGYPLALSKLKMVNKSWVVVGLIVAIAAHGTFDFLLFTTSVFTFALIPLFIAMAVAWFLMLRHANRHSVYVEHRMNPPKPELP